LDQRLGSGSFGEIYQGLNTLTNESIAIKIEEQERTPSSQLHEEYKILKYLQGEVGIPRIQCYFSEGCYNMMVLEVLGPNLGVLFQYYKKYFNLKSVLILAEQMLTRLELLHSRHFIHRDIKPENIVIGKGADKNNIYLIDFGLSKRFRNNKTGEHIPYRDAKSLCGTARYVSIYAHLGIEQSRRDDLESLGYTLMYFIRGDLPWQGFKGKTKKEKYMKILEKKIECMPEVLCKGYPDEFASYFQYCRSLQFEEKPDYAYLKGLFNSMWKDCEKDGKLLDWDDINNEENNSKYFIGPISMQEDKFNFKKKTSIKLSN